LGQYLPYEQGILSHDTLNRIYVLVKVEQLSDVLSEIFGKQLTICEDKILQIDGKKIKGPKRFILTDTQGLLLAVLVCSAAKSEKEGVLGRIKKTMVLNALCARIKHVWAVAGYRGEDLLNFAQKLLSWVWQVVTRKPDRQGFEVLPRRWVVEKTLGWFNHKRRLSKDYESLYASMISILIKRQ